MEIRMPTFLFQFFYYNKEYLFNFRFGVLTFGNLKVWNEQRPEGNENLSQKI